MKIQDWGYAAFMAALFGAMTSMVIEFLIGIPQQWESSVFAGMPVISCGVVVFLPRIWRRMRGRTKDDPGFESMPPIEQHIDDIWGPSLEKMAETIDLAEQRIQDAVDRLEFALNGQKSHLYLVIGLGYRAVRLARAIRYSCVDGYPDEACAHCRNLMDLEANIWFIMVSGDAEGNCERWMIWENAKFYRYVRENRSKLDSSPSEDEWQRMTDDYRKWVDEYGEDDLKNENAWAIAYREGGSKKIKAWSVTARAFHCMPYLERDRHLLHEDWKNRRNHLNSMVHISPRSIFMSQSSPRENVIVSGQSALGLRDPVEEATSMILNISSAIANNILPEKTEKSEKLGKQTMDAFKKTLEILHEVPAAANPWWQRKSESSK